MESVQPLMVGSGQVHFRGTRAQWAWLVGSVAVAVALVEVVFALTTSPPPGSTFSPIAFFAFFIGFFAVFAALGFRWQGTTLTHDALVVRTLWPRAIAWPYIASITIEPLHGAQTIVVRETSGRRTRLRSPRSGLGAWDGQFEAKFQTIVDWHQALRT